MSSFYLDYCEVSVSSTTRFKLFVAVLGIFSLTPICVVRTEEELTTNITVKACSQLCKYEHVFRRGHCDERDLSFIPSVSGCEEVTLLELQGNHITTISEKQMSEYLHVRTLDISRNQLTSLEPGTFQTNHHLTNILISYNILEVLKNNTFIGTHVQRIYLDNNRLTVIEIAAFEGLSKLKTLRLEGNFLTYIPEGLFTGLHVLHDINLSNNRLNDTFPENFGLGNLRILDIRNNRFRHCASILFLLYNATYMLYFAGNPFICECHCKIVQTWINDTDSFSERTPSLTPPVTCTFSNGTTANVTESLILDCLDRRRMTTTPGQTKLSHFSPVVSDAGPTITRKNDGNQLPGLDREDDIPHVNEKDVGPNQTRNTGETSEEYHGAHWTSYYTAIIITVYFMVLFGRWFLKNLILNNKRRYPENV